MWPPWLFPFPFLFLTLLAEVTREEGCDQKGENREWPMLFHDGVASGRSQSLEEVHDDAVQRLNRLSIIDQRNQ